MEPFIAEIRAFGFSFAPRGWARCDGQLLSISQNTALFSILGTTYGGDGQTTFGLPDLRGRAPIHDGNSQGAGLPPYNLGQAGGIDNVQLAVQNLPNHGHTVNVNQGIAPGSFGTGNLESNPANSYLSKSTIDVYDGGPVNQALHPSAVSSVGGSNTHTNDQPSLVINFCIALIGIFPS